MGERNDRQAAKTLRNCGISDVKNAPVACAAFVAAKNKPQMHAAKNYERDWPCAAARHKVRRLIWTTNSAPASIAAGTKKVRLAAMESTRATPALTRFADPVASSMNPGDQIKPTSKPQR